jgi:hypothetical protein
MKPNNSSIFRQLLPHIAAVAIFALLALLYFKPLMDGKTLQQADLNHWKGMSHELLEHAKTEPDFRSAWTGTLFSGMPSYQITAPGYPKNYLGHVSTWLSLNDNGSSGIVFTALLSAYIFFFLLTGNFWMALLGAICIAFSSYNIVIIQAGHVTKGWAIAFMPLVLSGFLLVARKRRLQGGALLAFGLGVHIAANHIQITYYLAILCLVLFIAWAINTILKKDYSSLVKGSLTILAAVVLAVIPKTPGFYADLLMSRESLRGPTELTVPLKSDAASGTAASEAAPASTGLDRDYAFMWSYGRGETLSLLIPNIMGGTSTGFSGPDTHIYKELKAKGQRVGKNIPTNTYWGDKPFTSGPVYIGATVCFLFVLALFIVRNRVKWWLLGASALFVFLAWGKNFAWFNDWLFYHLPMYNKFRTPEMALVIPDLILPVLAVLGLKQLFTEEFDTVKLRKQIIKSLAITGGICLVLWLVPGLFFNFESENDKTMMEQIPDWYYSALLADRTEMFRSDALRSLVFIILSAGATLLLIAKNGRYRISALAAITILVLADLWTVDKRYLSDDNFTKKQAEQTFSPTPADKFILEDKSPSYRVLNLSLNTFNDATTSYFHKSIGGYHAAKLRRYQELITARIMPEIQLLANRLPSVTSMDALDSLFTETPTINMLNGRYIILSPNAAPLVNNEAFGNAWFVNNVNVVENADAELAALNNLDPRHAAVVDKRFENLLTERQFAADPTASIVMTEYRPEKVSYRTTASSQQLAVFSEIYFADGWKAFIDGQPAPHFRADWILRAMYIPAGEHKVEFRFEPDTFITLAKTGSIASIMLLLLVAGTFIFSLIRRKQKD